MILSILYCKKSPSVLPGTLPAAQLVFEHAEPSPQGVLHPHSKALSKLGVKNIKSDKTSK